MRTLLNAVGCYNMMDGRPTFCGQFSSAKGCKSSMVVAFFSSVVFFFAAGVLINADGFQTKKFPYVHAVNERKMDAFIQLGSVGSENECPKGRGS